MLLSLASTSPHITRSVSCQRIFLYSRRGSLPTSYSTLTATAVSPAIDQARRNQFMDAVAARRSIYLLANKSPISDHRIMELVEDVALHVPSSFNSQTTRMIVLLKQQHEKLWGITKDILSTIVPREAFATTSKKIDGFKAAYGTVLFYEDLEMVQKLQDRHPLYKDKFPQWSEQTNAMHQIILWTALQSEGFGCNLQHYNPLIDQRLSTEWAINPVWSLKGQLVFGYPTGDPKAKEYQPLDQRVFVHGMDRA